MGLARAASVRNALASLAVLAVVGLIAFGIPLFNRTLPADRPVAGGRPFDVGGGVSVVPPAGATVDVTGTRPASDWGTALFLVTGVRLVVVVTPYLGTLDGARSRLSGKITKSTGAQVATTDEAVRTAQGVDGRLGAYTAPGRLGTFAVFVAREVSVEVTASGPDAVLRARSAAVRASIRSVTFGGTP
jgi:hypothetical protein